MGAPDNGIIDLDALIAEPVRIRLGGQEFELAALSTEQYAILLRAQRTLSGKDDDDAEGVLQACDLLDELFPEVAKVRSFRKLAPVQLARVVEIMRGIAGAPPGNGVGPPPNRAARRRARSGS